MANIYHLEVARSGVVDFGIEIKLSLEFQNIPKLKYLTTILYNSFDHHKKMQ